MIVLHAAMLDQHWLAWSEKSPDSSPPPARRRGRKWSADAPVFLPFDAGHESLAAALREIVPSLAIDKKETNRALIWLPAANGQPIASSALIAEPPEAGTSVTLSAWSITAARLSVEAMTALLCACMDKETLRPGLVVGKDLAFWAAALRFAGALIARQQFLPSLAKTGDTYQARWEAVLSGPDAERLTKLAKAMPQACRALSNDALNAPATPAVAVLTEFLNCIVDYLVRQSPTAASAQQVSKRGKLSFDSLHDQWLYALRSPNGQMEGDLEELAKFANQIREWRRPVTATAAQPFRLCFRLEEPSEVQANGLGVAAPAQETGQGPASGIRTQTGPWFVRFLLQAADDLSLMIDAKEVWTRGGEKAALLKRDHFNVKEYLLSSLGQAAGICPRLEASLKTAAPSGYELDATGAHEFLSEKAWGLEQAGFGVLLPAWWTGKGTKLRLTARARVKSPQMQGGSGLTLEEIVKFDWEIALGEVTLTLAELEMLAKLKAPLVKIRGQWVQLNGEEIQAALELWRKTASSEARVRDLVQMALGAQGLTHGLAFEGVSATGWIADLLAQLEGRATFEELPTPQGFQGDLRPYQVRGLSWLAFLRRWGLGACLADDMGLGKTIQVLSLVQRDWETNNRDPILLICPMSVVGNWQKEAARFTPQLPVLVHHGLERFKGPEFVETAQRQAMVISSYALLHRDFELLKTVGWAGVVLDEAQNIKNPETKQARAARALPAGFKIALTGTPVENNVGDLWSIMEFLNPGFLGTQGEFKRNFFLPIQVERDPQATDRLKRLTGPFVLRRLKTDKQIIADLPDKMEMKVFCPLTKEQASLYAAVVKEAAESIENSEGIQRKGVVLATLSKLKQVCNHPAQFLRDNSDITGRSGKLARLTEMLEEMFTVGDRALVFTQFSEMGEILRRYLQETFAKEVLFLHGSVPKKQRDRMVDRFQNEADAPPVFLLSLKAGGTGLNLTRANHVFHFDRWWNPAVENQATDRAFRIGQTRNVQVHKFLCQGTLEEKIDEMIERKKEIAANVIGAGEAWLTELSTAELKELFALREEAVQE
jgi:SNF2 family DNA or RNA helicase